LVSLAAPTPTAPIPPASDYRRWPLFWFARLEGALEGGDLTLAAEAQLQLKRLGLRVEVITAWHEGGPGHAA
jgi:hypothetical protein